MEEFKDQLDLSRDEGDPVAEAMALHGIARIYIQDKTFDAAMDFLGKCASVCRANGLNEHLAEVLIDLGDGALTQQDTARAINLYSETLSIYRALEIPQGQVRALDRLSDTYQKQEQYDRTLNCLREGFRLCRDNDDKIGSLYFLEKIIALYRVAGDPAQLIGSYRELLTLAEQIGDRERMALGLVGLADVIEQTDNSAAAAPYLEMAHDIYLRLGQDREAGLIREHLGRMDSGGED